MDFAFQNILEWREALSKMEDHHFFDLIRMYLGEIKTPYNKQKLIEELSSFLRKDENKQNILKLLSKQDLSILTTIYLLKKATQKKLEDFFAQEIHIAELYEALMNLEERLLIYRTFNKEDSKILIKINPLLEELLKPYLTKDKILSTTLEAESIPPNSDDLQISPELLAAFVSVVDETKDLCKADGTFKKKFESVLQTVIPQYKKEFFQSLLHGFLNLGLFRQKDDGIYVLYDRISNFAHLSELEQYVYLCVAASGHFPRDVLQRYSTYFMDLLANIPKSGFSYNNIIKTSLLLTESFPSQSETRSSRFADLLKSYDGPKDSDSYVEVEAFINNALLFGILQLSGITDEGVKLYKVPQIPQTNNNKNISINSSFSVTIMPGMPFLKLAKLSKPLKVVRFDRVLQMEFTKKSVLNAFSVGETPESIIFDFTESSNHSFPQNLKVSIEDWFESYNSASLFNGYVLRIVPEKATLLENNNVLRNHISITLAPGVYLMDFASDLDAKVAIDESGLDFIGKTKSTTQEISVLPFPSLQRRSNFTIINRQASIPSPSDESIASIKESLYASINLLSLTEEEEEELKSRVSRGIIVNRLQLKPVSVRPEKNEASGMDFTGKIYVIEHAISSKNLLQIKYNDEQYLGMPKNLVKQNGDIFVTLILEPQKEEKTFSVGHAQNVKRIRGSIFKEQAR